MTEQPPGTEPAHRAYDAAAQQLNAIAGWIFANPSAAVDQLLEIADEYGASRAVTAMLGDAEQFGALSPTATDSYVADMADTLESTLESVLTARDRLDLATAERNKRQPGRPQVLNFGGREFILDPVGRELRAVDNPAERYHFGDDVLPVRHDAARPTLTEQLGKDGNVPAAQPTKDVSRSRSR
jgi:hypothetical protein